MASDNVQTFTDGNFEESVIKSGTPVLVDFWAPWCGPCRMMAPQFETAARNLAGRALAVKVDTDAVPELSERFRILSIPTLMIFRDGREVSRVSGVQSSADIESLVAQADAHVGGR